MEPKGRRNFWGIANSKEKGIQIEWWGEEGEGGESRV